MTTIATARPTAQCPEPERLVDDAQLAAAAFLVRYSGRSLDAYRHDLRGFLQWAADNAVAVLEATRPDIELYGAWMDQRGLAASTIDRRLSTVCGFYRFAHIDGRIADEEQRLLEIGQDASQVPFGVGQNDDYVATGRVDASVTQVLPDHGDPYLLKVASLVEPLRRHEEESTIQPRQPPGYVPGAPHRRSAATGRTAGWRSVIEGRVRRMRETHASSRSVSTPPVRLGRRYSLDTANAEDSVLRERTRWTSHPT